MHIGIFLQYINAIFMKVLIFIVCIVFVLAVIIYVLRHTWNIIPGKKWIKWLVVGVGIASIISMFAGFAAGLECMPAAVAKITYAVGTSWMFVMLYAAIVFAIADILTLCKILPKEFLENSIAGTAAIFFIVAGIMVYGNIHYYEKEKINLDIKTEKKIRKDLKIVMLSDLHLGFHNGRKELARWIDMINAENPDLILFGGDIVDISTKPLLEERMYEEFHRLKANAYACMGNHENFSGIEKATEFYKLANIVLLNDRNIQTNGINISGRKDFSDRKRESLENISAEMDKSMFSILLDHEPYYLEKAEECGYDFQFSGHTHYGQVWPVSWITDAIYECAYGSHKRGGTEYYVSSGMGIWGGKFRIGTQSEYVVVNIHN